MAEWNSIDNYLVGSGFCRREQDAVNKWHWALQNEAVLGIDFGNETKECIYQASFELGPPPNEKNREIEIYLNQILVEKVSAPVKYKTCFVGVPGQFYELKFKSKGNLVQIPEDNRNFAFVLMNFRVQKTEENIGVSENHQLIQNKYIEILQKYISICDENNLTYYAFYGTLLGAVRHQGFIPWDDDVDVAMPRADFNKFAQIMARAEEGNYYFNLSDNAFYGGYGKFGDRNTTFISKRDANQKTEHGMAIDVLPLDWLEPDYERRSRQLKKISCLQELIVAKTYCRKSAFGEEISFIKWFKMWAFSLVHNRNGLIKRLEKAFEESEKSNYLTVLARYYDDSMRNYYHKEFFSHTVDLKFGDFKIKAPQNYDACLRTEYGDAYLLYLGEKILKKKHSGIINPCIPYREYEKHILYRPISIKKQLIIGDMENVEKYLIKDHSKKNQAFILDIDNQNRGKIFYGCLVIGIDEVAKCYDDSYTILICTEKYESILQALREKQIENFYIYIDDCMWE